MPTYFSTNFVPVSYYNLTTIFWLGCAFLRLFRRFDSTYFHHHFPTEPKFPRRRLENFFLQHQSSRLIFEKKDVRKRSKNCCSLRYKTFIASILSK